MSQRDMEDSAKGVRRRVSRKALSLGLVGCWITSALLGVAYGLYQSSEDDLFIVIFLMLSPIYMASVAPFWLDAWRNPTLSTVAASIWAYVIAYVAVVAATAYWLRYAPAEGETPGLARSDPRVSPGVQEKAFQAWMAYVVLVGGAFIALLMIAVVVRL